MWECLAVGALHCYSSAGDFLSAIAEVQSQVTTSGAEQLALGLPRLAIYLPNLIVRAGSFVVGSGFSVGADHTYCRCSVRPHRSSLISPLLAAPAGRGLEVDRHPADRGGRQWGSGSSPAFARLLPEPRLRRRITRRWHCPRVRGRMVAAHRADRRLIGDGRRTRSDRCREPHCLPPC